MSRSRISVKRVVVGATTWGNSTIFSQVRSEEFIEPDAWVTIQENDSSDIFSLTYFDASLYASILEDTITEMRILGECNNEFRILKTRTDMALLIAKKYNIEQPTYNDELEGIDPKNLSKAQYKLDKLASDRKYVYESLVLTYIDLTMNQSFVDLIASITEVLDREKKRVILAQDEAKNKMSRRELAKQLRQQRNHIKSVNYDTDLAIEDLKTQVEDTALRSEIRSRFISKWQVARSEQHHQTIKVKEGRPLETIDYYKTRADHEQRVHAEVELMTNITINEKLEMVETWMTKYDKDMEKMDLKIQIKKNDYQNKLDYRMELEDTFSKHGKLMKDWVHFKDEREKARLYREKMTNAAISVQAWWRGLLVRMQLGPFKPVKKGKGAGAAAKKKK